MGMAMVLPDPYYLPIVRSKRYPNCWYCPRCEATYTPNLVWGYESWPRGSTNPADARFFGGRQLGDECPFCDRLPEGGQRAS